MHKLYDMPDFQQLKKWKMYDQNGYEALVKAVGSHKKILVLATKNAGKNTLQNSIVNFIHRSHIETLVLPCIETVNIHKVNAHKKIIEQKKICKNQKSYVACIQHNGDYDLPVSEYVNQFVGWFDCVLDLRNCDGERILCAIYEGNKSYKCVYQHKRVLKYEVAA